MSLRSASSVFLGVLVLMAICDRSCPSAFGANETEALEALTLAEEKILLCYGAVAEADQAGANISALLAVLNRAGVFLSQAESSYKMGDFDTAVDQAGQSQGELDGFVIEAKALTDMARQETFWGLLGAVASAVGAVGVICGGFAVWFYMKKRDETGGGVK
jgi:hypothetical protein